MTDLPDDVSIPAGSPDATQRRRGRRLRTSNGGDKHHNPWPIRAAVIGAIATLLASLGGLYFSAQTARQATEQAQLAQEAQTSERFSRSVEQLGSDSIAVRIGAVYSFARLMRDSETDQKAIIEILSSFVSLQAIQAPPLGATQTTRPAPVDLLTAIKILGVSAVTRTFPPMLLSQVNLAGFDLTSYSMPNADLSHAKLTYAKLTGADLTGSDLTGAHLTHADLSHAHLTGADLTGADLYGADLTGADLTGAHLTHASLFDADLTGADLTGADPTGADLTGITCSAATKWPDDFQARPQCG